MTDRGFVMYALLFIAANAVGEDPVAKQEHSAPLSPAMSLIKGGVFQMGNPIEDKRSPEYHRDEAPRMVHVDDFYMSQFVVTAEEFCRFLNDRGNQGYGWFGPGNRWATIELVDGKYRPRQCAHRCPAFIVNWAGAVAYCEWLSRETGRRYRLPAEAEWEYAARGTELRAWPWGNDPPLSSEQMDLSRFRRMPFYEFHGYRWMHKPWDEDHQYFRAPVGSFPKGRTPDGIYDMLSYHGAEIGEWCSDRYSLWPDAPAELREEAARMRVIRGSYEKDLERRRVNWLLLPLSGDGAVELMHPGRSWTRIGGDEREGRGLIRLAMDAEAEP